MPLARFPEREPLYAGTLKLRRRAHVDDANVLAMSLRSRSTAVAKEILGAWFSSEPIKTGVDAELIQRAKKLDSKYLIAQQARKTG